MSNFHVGQRVVCFDDSPMGVEGCTPRPMGEKAGVKYPSVGPVYTVKSSYVAENGVAGIILIEIDNSGACLRMGFSQEIGFPACRFRPVVERKTDISIFKSLLTQSKQPVTA